MKLEKLSDTESPDLPRLDKWLWAARFFKTRALAREAIDGGKVFVEGARSKPSREVRVGQEIRITSPGGEFTVIVEGLTSVRSSASLAATLYKETDESKDQRIKLKELHRLSRSVAPKDKPEGRDREKIRKLKEEG